MNKPQTARQVVAHNDAADSGNPMHVDAYAREMGFKAALVPGINVYGYLTRSALDFFGDGWLSDGAMRVRFRQPVFDGDTLTIITKSRQDDNKNVIDLDVVDSDQQTCVIAAAATSGDAHVVNESTHWEQMNCLPRHGPSHGPPHGSMPDDKWPAEPEQFTPGRVLDSVRANFPVDEADGYLNAMQDDHPIYRRAVHPAWLLRQANIIVDQNVAVDGWIHTESEVRHLGLLPYDCPLEVRACVLSEFKRKAHHYADLDVLMLADGDEQRPVLRVMHRAIYKIGESSLAC